MNISKPLLRCNGEYWVENNPAVISVFDVRITPLFSSAFLLLFSFSNLHFLQKEPFGSVWSDECYFLLSKCSMLTGFYSHEQICLRSVWMLHGGVSKELIFFSKLHNTSGYISLLIPQSSYVCLNKFFMMENNFAIYNAVRSLSPQKIIFI